MHYSAGRTARRRTSAARSARPGTGADTPAPEPSAPEPPAPRGETPLAGFVCPRVSAPRDQFGALRQRPDPSPSGRMKSPPSPTRCAARTPAPSRPAAHPPARSRRPSPSFPRHLLSLRCGKVDFDATRASRDGAPERDHLEWCMVHWAAIGRREKSGRVRAVSPDRCGHPRARAWAGTLESDTATSKRRD